MPRAFLIKKKSPSRELGGKQKPWTDVELQTKSENDSSFSGGAQDENSQSGADARGPFDLSVKSKKSPDITIDVSVATLPIKSPSAIIEFSPKIVTSSRISTPPIGVALIGRRTPSPDPVLKPDSPLDPLNPNGTSNVRTSPWQNPVVPTYIPFGLPFYPIPRPATDFYGLTSYLGNSNLVSPPLMPSSLSPPRSNLRLGVIEPVSSHLSRDNISPTSSLYSTHSPHGRFHLELPVHHHKLDMPTYQSPWIHKEGSTSPIPRSDSSDSGRESSSNSNIMGGVVSSSSSASVGGPAPRYQCIDCSKSYSTYSGLSRHRQFHCLTQAKKSFNCKYCDKVYVSLGALKMHIRTHTLPCKCKLCGKAFSRPWLLQGHIRTHTGEKPFACPHCSRAFADRSNLRAHLQTHSDVKKYSCKTCSKTFSRMSLLLKHADGGCLGGQVQR